MPAKLLAVPEGIEPGIHLEKGHLVVPFGVAALKPVQAELQFVQRDVDRCHVVLRDVPPGRERQQLLQDRARGVAPASRAVRVPRELR
jgi:hypothetical protein